MEPRRENGITVRFLAQTIINDVALPNQSGVKKFVDSLLNYHEVGKEQFENLNYYFFFHLEDFGVDDKSEIDFILWNEKVILPVEVKSFTDANSPDVKKEIIRNYFHINNLKNRSEFFFKKEQQIFPVLLYSQSYQNWKRNTNSSTDYFNKDFLLTKGKDQSQPLDKWDRGGYPIPSKYYEDEKFQNTLKIVNSNLFFTTWEKIFKIPHRSTSVDIF